MKASDLESLRRFGAILEADLKERSRSVRFWVVLGLACLLTWLCFPSVASGYSTVSIGGGARGIYSSAWVGMSTALVMSTCLSLLGFYVVRGTLIRDLDTRVWQLLVATPMTRRTYLLAKACSHLLVLGLVALAGLGVAFAAQMVRGEDRSIHLLELVKPLLVIALPSLAVTALLALWFDMVPWLRRTAGNVLYFFIWSTLTCVFLPFLLPGENPGARNSWKSDPAGLVLFARDLDRQMDPLLGKRVDTFQIGAQKLDRPPVLLPWIRWDVRFADLMGRALWLALSLVGVLCAAPFLDRCAAHAGSAKERVRDQSGRSLKWLSAALGPLQRRPLGILLAAEIQMVLRPRKRSWWLALLGLVVPQAFVPLNVVALLALGAWTLSLDIFGRAILRERDTGTSAFVFSAPGATFRVLLARWLMLFTFAFLPVLPALLRFAGTQPPAAAALFAVALSIPTWGLALGALTRNARGFELLACVLLYVSIQGVAALNVTVAPLLTMGWHLTLLPVGVCLLLLRWPSLRDA